MSNIVITSIGMVSALGLDAATACAAARAGIDRLRALDLLNWAGDDIWSETPVAGHSVPVIATGFVGAAKAHLLAHHALRDLLPKGMPVEAQQRSALYLLVSDAFLEDALHRSWGEDGPLPSEIWHLEAHRMIQQLVASANLSSLPVDKLHLFFGHHAEWADVLSTAQERLCRGDRDSCIVGAVDCALEPRRLIAAAEANLVKTANNPAGHMPGEASGFLLLERNDRRTPTGSGRFGRIMALDSDAEESIFSEKPITGRILAKTLTAVLPEESGFWLSDHNGEAARAQEWGTGLVSATSQHPASQWPIWYPALSFGELGAATGVVATIVALRAFQRQYAPARNAVLSLASDNGARAGICLAAME